MRFEADAVAQVPLEEAWSWWTDYGEPGDEFEMGHGVGRSRRRIVSASEDRVELEDAAALPMGRSAFPMRHTVELHEAGHWIEERTEHPVPMVSRWEFSRAGEGTRIRRVMDLSSGVADAFSPLARPVARALAERDLKHHVRTMERELRR